MNSLFLLLTIFLGAASQETVTISRHPETESSLTLKIYDVTDLVQVPKTWNDIAEKGDPGKEMAERAGILAEVIRSFIQPPLKKNVEDVKAIGTATIVAQLPEKKQKWIEAFLDAQRAANRIQYLVELTYFTVSDKAFKELPRSENPSVILVDAGIEKLFDRWKDGKECDIVTAPRILIQNREKGIISCLNQFAYVSGYDLHEKVEPTRSRIVDPVVEIAEEGFIFEVRAVQLAKGNIGMTISSKHMSVPRPIPEIKTELGLISRVTVEKVEMSTTIIVKSGGSMISTMPSKKEGGNHHAIKMTVTRVEEKDLQDLK